MSEECFYLSRNTSGYAVTPEETIASPPEEKRTLSNYFLEDQPFVVVLTVNLDK